MSLSHIWGPSGGAQYHLSAIRFQNSLWRAFREDVSRWMNDWSPSNQILIIFGSSGGWTIPKDFVSRFKKVIVVEPDPIARKIFSFRFRSKTKLIFNADYQILPWFQNLDDQAAGSNFQSFLDGEPEAAILFSNILGQIPILLKNNPGKCLKNKSFQTESRKMVNPQKIFLKSLRGRNWASYHDILSAQLRLKSTQLALQIPASMINAENIASHFFDLENMSSNSAATVIDHETEWINSQSKIMLSPWRLSKSRTHIVGFVHS